MPSLNVKTNRSPRNDLPNHYWGRRVALQGLRHYPSVARYPDDSPFLGVYPQWSPFTLLRVPSRKSHSMPGLTLTESCLICPRLNCIRGIQMSFRGLTGSPTQELWPPTTNNGGSFGQTAESQRVEERDQLPHPTTD